MAYSRIVTCEEVVIKFHYHAKNVKNFSQRVSEVLLCTVGENIHFAENFFLQTYVFQSMNAPTRVWIFSRWVPIKTTSSFVCGVGLKGGERKQLLFTSCPFQELECFSPIHLRALIFLNCLL